MNILNSTASIILATLVTGIYSTAVKAQVSQDQDQILKEGSLGGIIVGMQPWVAKSTIDVEGFDEDEEQALHVEAFYQYQLNDNIAITPGAIYISNPDNNSDNDDLFIGALRTTFTF